MRSSAALGLRGAAIESLEQGEAMAPAEPFGHLFLATVLGSAGRIDKARAEMARFEQQRPGFTLSRFRAVEPSNAPAFLQQRQRVYEGLRRAGMPE